MNKSGIICAVVCAAVAAVACLYAPEQPGLNYDQCWDTLAAMNMAQGQPRMLDDTRSVAGFTSYLPTAVGSVSVKTAYVLLPFIKLFGPSVTLVRVFAACAGVAAVIGTWLCARVLFGPAVACVSAALLATDPSFTLYTRLSGNYTVLVAACAVWSVVFFVRALRTGALRYWYAACFILGMGADIYLAFWGFIAALLITAGVLRPRISLPARHYAGGVAAFLAGMPFFAHYFIASRFVLVKNYSQGYQWAAAPAPVDRLVFWDNWWQHAATVGNDFFNLIAQYNGFPARAPWGVMNHYKAVAVCLLLGVALVHALWRLRACAHARTRPHAQRVHAKPLIAVWMLWAGVLIASAAYVYSGGYPHLVVGMPFMCMALAYILVAGAQWARARYAYRGIAVITCAALLYAGMQAAGVRDAIYNWRHASRLGHGFALSPSLYRLSDYLVLQGIDRPWCVGWGIANQLPITSAGKVRTRQLRFRDVHDAREVRDLYERAVSAGDWYIFSYKAGWDERLHENIFFDVVRRRGLKVYERGRIMLPGNGREAYRIYYVAAERPL